MTLFPALPGKQQKQAQNQQHGGESRIGHSISKSSKAMGIPGDGPMRGPIASRISERQRSFME
jgi:hypothetical protein